MGFRQRRKPVVDRMCRRQAGTFKPQSTEQRVRLDHLLHCLGDDALFYGQFRQITILHQDVVAQPGQAESGSRRGTAGQIAGKRLGAGIGFEPSGQGIAHSRHQQTHRRFSDDCRIDQHQVRIASK